MFKVQNSFKGADVPRTIRFTESMFQKLNELSEEHQVSFNLLVLQCCQYAIDNLEKEDK